jgi:methyl coenzyme M reductase beta subunit
MSKLSVAKLTVLMHFAYKCSGNAGTSSVNYGVTRPSKIVADNKLYYEDMKKLHSNQHTFMNLIEMTNKMQL